MNMLAYLLLDRTPLRLDGWHLDTSEHQITLRVTSMQPRLPCPLCEMPAHRLHSRYARTLADLPWGAHYRDRWQLQVRKFFCDNMTCPSYLFTERLPGVCAPWARRTFRLAARLLALGLALGGTASARLSPRLGLTSSRNTLLRVIRRVVLPPIPPTRPRRWRTNAMRGGLRSISRHGPYITKDGPDGPLPDSWELARIRCFATCVRRPCASAVLIVATVP
jgi:transposase